MKFQAVCLSLALSESLFCLSPSFFSPCPLFKLRLLCVGPLAVLGLYCWWPRCFEIWISKKSSLSSCLSIPLCVCFLSLLCVNNVLQLCLCLVYSVFFPGLHCGEGAVLARSYLFASTWNLLDLLPDSDFSHMFKLYLLA